MSNDIFTSSLFLFLYLYQLPRYSCQNIFPLPIHPCLYRADFFIFMSSFINQESLVPSISKRKRESENQPYNKTTWRPTMAATNLFKRERSHIYQPRVLILHVCVHNAPQSRVVRRNITSINAASWKYVFTKVALSCDAIPSRQMSVVSPTLKSIRCVYLSTCNQ